MFTIKLVDGKKDDYWNVIKGVTGNNVSANESDESFLIFSFESFS